MLITIIYYLAKKKKTTPLKNNPNHMETNHQKPFKNNIKNLYLTCSIYPLFHLKMFPFQCNFEFGRNI